MKRHLTYLLLPAFLMVALATSYVVLLVVDNHMAREAIWWYALVMAPLSYVNLLRWRRHHQRRNGR